MKTEPNTSPSPYDQQATDFLSSNGLQIRITLSDTKVPAWVKDGVHGHHYRVTIHRPKSKGSILTSSDQPFRSKARCITFDFWDSVTAMESGESPIPYSVLACISGDIHYAETFADFCSDYGYDQDSITALQTFRRCSAFAKRLRAFFTESELSQLSEIQ